jgi:hypothetical protein
LIQTSLIQAPGEFFGIDRFDCVEQLRGLARFVGLKMADEMKLGIRQRGQRGMLFRELLNVVFAKHAQTERVSLAHDRGGKFLCDRNQCDLIARAAAAAYGRLDTLFDLVNVF